MDGSNNNKGVIINNNNNNNQTTTINTIEKFIDRYKSEDLNLYINGEFLELKELTNDIKRNKTHTTNYGCLDCNKYKNRYKDILPYDDTRVILDKIDSIDGSDYINANYVFGVSQSYSYIGAQAPLSTTVFDFMRMFLQLNINTVICACNEYEGLKLKCYRYWPLDKDEILEFDNKLSRIQVRLHSIEYSQSNDYIIRKLLIKYKQQINGNNNNNWSKEHLLTQIHITSWPDHGVLQSIETIVKLLDLAHDNLQLSSKQQQQSSYLCVHCSAGCGRTGTIIAIDYCYNLVYLNKLNNDFHPVKIAKLLREQRMTMIQTIEQYQMFYDSLFYIFDKYLKENSKTSINNRASSSSSTNNLCFNNNIYFNKSELFNNNNNNNNNNDEYVNNNDDGDDNDDDDEDGDCVDTNLREIKSPKLKESRKTRKSKKIKDGIMNQLRRFKTQKSTTTIPNDGSHTNRKISKKYDLNNNRIDGDDDSSRFDSSSKCNNYADSDEDVSTNGAYGDGGGDDTNNDSDDDYSDSESKFEFKPSTIEHLNNLKLTNDTYRSQQQQQQQQQPPVVSVRRQPYISINDDKYKVSNNVGGAAASIFGSSSTNNNRKSVLNENSDSEETSIRSNLSISGKFTEHHAKYTDLKQLNPPMKAQLVRETTFSTSVLTNNDDREDPSLKSSYRPTPPPRTKSKFKKMNSSFEFRTTTNSKIDDHQQAFNKNDLIDANNSNKQQQRSMSANNSNRSFSLFDNQEDYN